MTTITSKEAQNRFGHLIDMAQREPVIVTRHDRPVAVVLSSEDYKRFEAFEDAIWAERARNAAKSGFVGKEESTSFIERILNADA